MAAETAASTREHTSASPSTCAPSAHHLGFQALGDQPCALSHPHLFPTQATAEMVAASCENQTAHRRTSLSVAERRKASRVNDDPQTVQRLNEGSLRGVALERVVIDEPRASVKDEPPIPPVDPNLSFLLPAQRLLTPFQPLRDIQHRRTRLFEAMPLHSMAIFTSHDVQCARHTVHHRFRQEASFHYLSGLRNGSGAVIICVRTFRDERSFFLGMVDSLDGDAASATTTWDAAELWRGKRAPVEVVAPWIDATAGFNATTELRPLLTRLLMQMNDECPTIVYFTPPQFTTHAANQQELLARFDAPHHHAASSSSSSMPSSSSPHVNVIAALMDAGYALPASVFDLYGPPSLVADASASRRRPLPMPRWALAPGSVGSALRGVSDAILNRDNVSASQCDDLTASAKAAAARRHETFMREAAESRAVFGIAADIDHRATGRGAVHEVALNTAIASRHERIRRFLIKQRSSSTRPPRGKEDSSFPEDLVAPTSTIRSTLPLIRQVRAVKSEDELLALRHCASITARCFRAAMLATRPTTTVDTTADIAGTTLQSESRWQRGYAPTEADIETVLMAEARMLGADGLAYLPVVAAGANASHSLHYTDNNDVLRDGELLTVDAGALVDDTFPCDCTRVWPISGHFTLEQRGVYDLLLGVQEKLIASVVPGMSIDGLQILALNLIHRCLVQLGVLDTWKEQWSLVPAESDSDQKERKQANPSHTTLFFPHPVSHFLGHDLHEYVTHTSTLQTNNVLTIEPGLYFPNPRRLEDQAAALRDASRRSSTQSASIPEPPPNRFARAGYDLRRLPPWLSGTGMRIEDLCRVTSASAHSEPEVLTAAVPKTASAIEEVLGHR